MAKQRQQVTIYLFKDDVADFADVVAGGTLVPVRAGLPFVAAVYTKSAPPAAPKWLTYVAAVSETTPKLENASASAVILIKTSGRIFAVSFGFGRNIIDTDKIEYGFGLRVVLNIVNHSSLKSIDAKSFDTITRHTLSQINVGSSLEAFGIDTYRDLLRAVVGSPTNCERFGKQVVGKDALAISIASDVAALAATCDELLIHYDKDTYKSKFAFVDNIVLVKSPQVVAALNDILVAAVKNKDSENIYLGPPDVVDWGRIGGFSYSSQGSNKDTFDDLDADDLFNALEKRGEIDLNAIKGLKIREHSNETNDIVNRWSAYKGIAFETDYNSARYVLSFGNWFEVHKDFASDINTYVDGISSALTLPLPTAHKKEVEGDYNERASKNSSGSLALLDKKNIVIGGSQIEVCDLISLDRHLIHVKRKTRSATLSHLFAQGLVSAQILYQDKNARKLISAKLPTAYKMVISPTGQLDPSTYTVVYAIITGTKKDINDALPFFSRVNLANQAKLLIAMGFNVALHKIEIA